LVMIDDILKPFFEELTDIDHDLKVYNRTETNSIVEQQLLRVNEGFIASPAFFNLTFDFIPTRLDYSKFYTCLPYYTS
ncbi:hypothetical protein L9F63_004807, partial [Diploptera punctata]